MQALLDNPTREAPTYAGQDPINQMDPSGLSCEPSTAVTYSWGKNGIEIAGWAHTAPDFSGIVYWGGCRGKNKVAGKNIYTKWFIQLDKKGFEPLPLDGWRTLYSSKSVRPPSANGGRLSKKLGSKNGVTIVCGESYRARLTVEWPTAGHGKPPVPRKWDNSNTYTPSTNCKKSS